MVYSSAAVHNNRSSRVLCGLQARPVDSRERDDEWRGSLGLDGPARAHWHLQYT